MASSGKSGNRKAKSTKQRAGNQSPRKRQRAFNPRNTQKDTLCPSIRSRLFAWLESTAIDYGPRTTEHKATVVDARKLDHDRLHDARSGKDLFQVIRASQYGQLDRKS